MKIKKILIILLSSVFFTFNTSSEEVNFQASNMDLKDNGNIVIGYNSITTIPSDKVDIKSKKATYIKNKNLIIFTGKVILTDRSNNIVINI